MSQRLRLAAVDLGAESGRVVVGGLVGDRVELDEVHRFANRPQWLPDGLHWNLTALFGDVLDGLALAARDEPLDGIGVDAWGCDYGLLDARRRLIGLPFHYRDARTSDEVLARAHARVPRRELYRRTGIQTMAINTLFQLCAERDGAAGCAQHIALVPDLLGLWMTGVLANEVTVASTTGLLEVGGDRWATDLVARLALPAAPFDGATVAAGHELGPLLAGHERAGAAIGTPVRAVAGHDTASAFAAAPIAGPGAAILSSGTWSLLGLELDEPCLGDDAADYNLTNERGVGNTVRLLRNVMGLWLVQECRRAWGGEPDYAELQALAARAPAEVALFDPDHVSLLAPGDMPARIEALCRSRGQRPCRDRGELVRSILVSLACKYRFVLERLEAVSGRRVEVVHVIGGGARNALLCQLTADLLARPVLAGPVEATALGNVLVQAWARGAISSLEQLRAVAARSSAPQSFEPGQGQPAETYQRFLEATGLTPVRPIDTASR